MGRGRCSRDQGSPLGPDRRRNVSPGTGGYTYADFAGNIPPAVDHDPAPQVRAMKLLKADYELH
eukprot:13048275-Heterocapsa_arctica.AAC.1